jgi:hypothetical protein
VLRGRCFVSELLGSCWMGCSFAPSLLYI